MIVCGVTDKNIVCSMLVLSRGKIISWQWTQIRLAHFSLVCHWFWYDVPEWILFLLANTLFWPLGTLSHWVYFPSKRQGEDECGARCLLHSYLLTLLMLNSITDLPHLCHSWVNDVLHSKKIISPSFVTNQLDSQPNCYCYSHNWVKKYCLSLQLSVDQYRALFLSVKRNDVDVGHGVDVSMMSSISDENHDTEK
jgi:hypothetical protein